MASGQVGKLLPQAIEVTKCVFGFKLKMQCERFNISSTDKNELKIKARTAVFVHLQLSTQTHTKPKLNR